MRGIAALLIVVGALVGCHADQESLKEDVATALCRCPAVVAAVTQASSLPGTQAQCVTKLGATAPTITDQCSDCVFEHETSCGVLVNTCIPLCDPPVTGGGDDQE